MDRHAWKPFLQRWSEEWHLAHPDLSPDGDPWLGCPPATEEEVQALESRLGCVLPPSFREFLLVTNGWRHAGNFVWSLRGTEELGWLKDLEPMWVEAYADADWDDEDDEDGEDGEDDESPLARSLLISLEADSGAVYLDPGDVDEHGEWAAYDVFSWRASDPDRYGSFYEKMYDFYAGFHALDRPACDTRREWDAKVEDARLASLRGEVEGPLDVLAQAARFGRDRAEFLAFQLRTLLREEAESDPLYRLLTHTDAQPSWTLDEGLFAEQVLPLLFVAHDQAHRYGGGSTVQLLWDLGPEWLKRPIGRYQALRKEPGFRIRFGNPEFDEAAHAALDAGDDEAWPRLREALAHWRPLHEDQVAPIALLADPRAARLITPERGRELLATARG
ncbi:SMI1/KNR4 family protein [Nonomuraea sp. PA05]|uniref:SMI1/KNR4 family protein n=1 Tax=Nonomuraea sp. PA05 TaxID=2604466 RepID=UPI0011D81002|nr:SMI1/KNR4 family protein [Nonomuraea sp. PA05]TYB57626.1 SMI1/KNR4 family protein [Nonomuraea sp. PA05]